MSGAARDLFPALNLPFHLRKNGGEIARTPLSELQALSFVVHELGLYLDTHAEDQEAFETYKELLELAREGRERYTKLYGPICKTDLAEAGKYVWLSGPWPWEYAGKAGD